MAGVESMIVEEKQAPTKQIDREKVSELQSLQLNRTNVYTYCHMWLNHSISCHKHLFHAFQLILFPQQFP